MGGQSSGKKGGRARLDTAPTHRNTGHLGQVGFEGQDAFDPDADELALDGRTQSARGTLSLFISLVPLIPSPAPHTSRSATA